MICICFSLRLSGIFVWVLVGIAVFICICIILEVCVYLYLCLYFFFCPSVFLVEYFEVCAPKAWTPAPDGQLCSLCVWVVPPLSSISFHYHQHLSLSLVVEILPIWELWRTPWCCHRPSQDNITYKPNKIKTILCGADECTQIMILRRWWWKTGGFMPRTI